jgi:hypothetical protein
MEMHVGYLARHLTNRGHLVYTICSPASPLEKDLRESGFDPYLLAV